MTRRPRVLMARLLSLFRTRGLDRSLDEELQSHLDLAMDEHIAHGRSPDEARAAALRSFGSVALVKERYRERRGVPVLDALWQDVRYACRGFRRTPGFTAVALVTLTLAAGSTLSVFSLLNALVFRTLPVRDPHSLVQLLTVSATNPERTYGLTLGAFLELSRTQSVFSTVIGSSGGHIVTVDVDGTRTSGAVWGLTGNGPSALGLQPTLGRLLTDQDESLTSFTAEPVVVLGHRFWQRHFDSRADVVGRSVDVEGVRFTIVGVAPPRFAAFGLTMEPDLTMPLLAEVLWIEGLSVSELLSRPARWVQTTGRLKPGVSLDTARAHLETLWPHLRAVTLPPTLTVATRDEFLSARLVVESAAYGYEPTLRARFVRPLWILLGIASVLVLVACLNLASLSLARAAARRHELGVRTALGAGRGRLIQQGLTEGLLLASVGTSAGVAFGYWASRQLSDEILRDYIVPSSVNVSPDGRIILVACAVAMLAGTAMGLMPMSQTVRGGAPTLLRQNPRVLGGIGRMGPWLVGTQVALSLALLLNAGLLVRTVGEIAAVDAGYQRHGVFVAYPTQKPQAYKSVDNDRYYPALVERLGALPSVEAVGISQLKPAGGGGGWKEQVAVVGGAPDAAGVTAEFTPLSPGFFATLGIPVTQGRDFTWADRSTARPVAMLSRSLAHQLFPDVPAIGQRVRIGTAAHRQDLEIVGVVADARLYQLKSGDTRAIYVPSLQEGEIASFKALVLRAEHLSLADVRAAVESLGHEYVTKLETLSYVEERARLRERLTASMASLLGGLTLLLATVGLYGLLSYSVRQRHKEIAIRLALGARPGRIVRAVVGAGLVVTLAGAAVGLGVGLLASRLVRSFLFGVSPYDVRTLTGAVLLLVTVALVACLLPATRAARVQPTTALRLD